MNYTATSPTTAGLDLGTINPSPSRASLVMTDCIDGSGLAYWAEARRIKRDPDTSYVTSFEVRDHDPDGTGRQLDGKWHHVNARVIEAAAKRLVASDLPMVCRRDLAAQFIGQEWETDGEGCDTLIQTAIYGKLIFG